MLDRQSMLRRRKSVTLEEAAEMLTGIEGWNKENRAAIDLMRESIQLGELEPESVHFWDEDSWSFDRSRAVLDQHATTVTVANFEAWRARTFPSADALQQAVTAMGQATDNAPRVSGKATRPSRTVCSGSRSASVVVPINGREAIPVRAIPLVAPVPYGVSYLVEGLMCCDRSNAMHGLTAYQWSPGVNQPAEVPPVQWRRVHIRLVGLAASIKSEESAGRVSPDEGLDRWSREVTPFVWTAEALR